MSVLSRRRAKDSQREALHPNAQKLLDTTVELLETTPIEQVSLAAVLEESEISNGSLYHHFEDFQDLIEQAVVQRYVRGLNESLAAIADLLESADATDFRRRVEAVLETLHDQNRRPYRMARLETLGALPGRPRLAERIGRAQQEVTRKQTEYYAELQRRGWIRDDLDPAAISVFVTASFLGRVVDDITEEHVDPNEWLKVALIALKSIVFID
jgi:AcrR family transcriptional regulator